MDGYTLITNKHMLRNHIPFKKDVRKSLKTFVDVEMDDEKIVKCISGADRTMAPNYRIDLQGPPVKNPPFTRRRVAIQINDDAPDPALRGITRSKGGSGGSYPNSQPTVAQFEFEIGLSVTAATPDIVREAFYQSMIPETCFPGTRVMLHSVRVNKKGEIWIKYNQTYLDMVAGEQAKADKGGSKPGKGASAKVWEKYDKKKK